MEIILRQFDIEEAISSQWNANKVKSKTIENDRKTALETAIKSLTTQFQREIDACLDSNIQLALNLKVVEPQQLDIFSVYAVLDYNNTHIELKRDNQNWSITSSIFSVNTTGDLLQKTLLLELGRSKDELRFKH